jgi:cellulose synthase/poly-beta-1,6-N-acetylglucosamine synthase-like glycosyltransferase
MVFYLPIDISGFTLELVTLFSALVLVLLSWICLFVTTLRSHANTPVIKNSSTLIRNNKYGFNQPFVRVIVPARNEEENIEKCLLSVLTQEYNNFEVVAVDDDSEDQTLEIMKCIKSKQEFSKKLRIISLSSKEDGWTGKTWASQH